MLVLTVCNAGAKASAPAQSYEITVVFIQSKNPVVRNSLFIISMRLETPHYFIPTNAQI